MAGLSFYTDPFRTGSLLQAMPASQLSESQQRDALLVKTTLDGKDFQTARKEVAILEKAPPSDSLRASLPAGWGQDPQQEGQAAYSLELTHLEIRQVSAEIQTSQGRVQVEATQLTYDHLEIRASPQGGSAKKDPLVIDLADEGPRTTGSTGAKSFDLAGDGDVRPTSFVAGSSAFLVLDRNANGRIDDGRELFGDQHGAANGFEELRKFDANSDGQISAADPVYGDLRLLFGDGHTTTLGDTGVQSISLAVTEGSGSTSSGDAILQQSCAQSADGRSLPTYALGLQRFDQTV